MRSALLSLVVKGLFQGSGCGSLSAHLASWLRLQDGWCCFLTTRLAVDVSQLVLKLVISVTVGSELEWEMEARDPWTPLNVGT